LLREGFEQSGAENVRRIRADFDGTTLGLKDLFDAHMDLRRGGKTPIQALSNGWLGKQLSSAPYNMSPIADTIKEMNRDGIPVDSLDAIEMVLGYFGRP